MGDHAPRCGRECEECKKTVGVKRYDEFVVMRIRSQEEAFTAPLPHTRLKLFKAWFSQPQNKSEVAVKDQRTKAMQLLLAVHSGREINERVLSHESSPHSPSLTRKGEMHHGNKCENPQCISPNDLNKHKPETTAAVLDGAVLVQMLRPTTSVTIRQYYADVFAPYILSWFERNDRVDVVWDVYSKTSQKSGTREQRDTGARRRVTLSTKVPGNWAAFIRVDLNKQELFVELAKSLKLLTLPQGKELFTTMMEERVTSPPGLNNDALTPCTQEKADTPLPLHASADTLAGHCNVIVRSSDSDVVVLAIAAFVALGQRIDELCVAVGVRSHFRYIPAQTIAQNLGPSKAMALPAFHALTGRETTSPFFSKGRKAAWSVWQSMPELTLPLQPLSGPCPTTEMITTYTPILQKFVLKLYGASGDDIKTVDAARLSLFLHKGRDFDHMPPSSDALHQHLLRVAYQSGRVGHYAGQRCCYGVTLAVGLAKGFCRHCTNTCVHSNFNYFKGLARIGYLQMQDRV